IRGPPEPYPQSHVVVSAVGRISAIPATPATAIKASRKRGIPPRARRSALAAGPAFVPRRASAARRLTPAAPFGQRPITAQDKARAPIEKRMDRLPPCGSGGAVGAPRV